MNSLPDNKFFNRYSAAYQPSTKTKRFHSGRFLFSPRVKNFIAIFRSIALWHHAITYRMLSRNFKVLILDFNMPKYVHKAG